MQTLRSPICTPPHPGNNFSAVAMRAPSDLHFLLVWCTWVEEGHYNSSLWSALCACLTLWVSGGASYVVVRIANASRVWQSGFCVVCPNIWQMSNRPCMISRFKEVLKWDFTALHPLFDIRTSNENYICISEQHLKHTSSMALLPLYMFMNSFAAWLMVKIMFYKICDCAASELLLETRICLIFRCPSRRKSPISHPR